MTTPIIADTGHAFLVVLGGPYNSSVLSESIVRRNHTVPAAEPMIELDLIGSLEGIWVFGEKDYRWVSTNEIKKYVCTDFDGLATLTKRAILDCGGAWVMRVYVKPLRKRSK